MLKDRYVALEPLAAAVAPGHPTTMLEAKEAAPSRNRSEAAITYECIVNKALKMCVPGQQISQKRTL